MIKSPDQHARRVLYGGNNTKMARATGLTRGLLCRRKQQPGDTTLDELSLIAWHLDLTDQEIAELVRERVEQWKKETL